MKTMKGKIVAALAALVIAGAAFTLGSGVAGITIVPRTASAAPTASYSQDAVIGIYNAANPAVVEIKVTEQGTGYFGQSLEGQGSGFIIDNQGHIVTNNHVVDGASSIQITLSNGKTVDAKVIGTDSLDDLALISVDSSAVQGITPLQLADSSVVKPGQMAIALGSPYGLTNSITVGIISGLDRSLSDSGSSSLSGLLQTDAAINPGNSGGPLLDSQGHVIGVNTAVQGSGADGIGFAVPSNTVTRVLPSLLAGKQIVRPWLGISGMALSSTTVTNLNLSVDKGVYVVTVVTNGPAEKAGLKGGGADANGTPTAGGDVITAVDSKPVTSVPELSTYLNTKQVGDNVTLSVLRDGKNINVQVTLGKWVDQTSTQTTPQQIPNLPWGR
jgi:2-alkenal reductase